MRPPRYLAGLLIALAVVLVVPVGIVGVGFLMETTQPSAGRMPGGFFWVFALGGGLSPLVGAITSRMLRRYQQQAGAGEPDRSPVWEFAVRALSLLAMLAPIGWFVLLMRVVFLSGGSR